MELKRYQQDAVNQLVSLTKKYLNGNAKKIYLEAPTGAGKTVMASAAMEEIAGTLPFSHDCVTDKVAFIWIAPNKLHEQSYLSMKSFFKYTNNMRPIVWDEVDHTLGRLEHGDVLFLNWPSINKEDNLIWRQSETKEDLLSIIRSTREDNTPIVVIIDEENQYAGATATRAQEVLRDIQPDVEIRISATPNYPRNGGFQQIVVDRADVVREQMIKKDVVINAGLDENDVALGETQFFIEKALKKREELKRIYERIGNPVNPLLLIQLPNDNKSINADDNAIMEAVKAYLTDKGINEDNNKLAIWLSEDKKNLDKISEPQNMTEVLLFKEAISKGWDCPRAAVLLIFRKMESQSFTIQTVGRILRMPQQKYYSDDALNHGYVYTNLQNDYIEIRSDVDYLQKGINEAVLRNNVTPISLPAESVGTTKVQNTLGYRFREILRKTLTERWQLNQNVLDFSTDDDELIDPNNAPAPGKLFKPCLTKEQEQNRAKLVTNAGLDLDVHRLYSIFPKDMTIDPSHVGRYEVPANGRASIAKTQGEVDRLFKNFCMANLIGFDKRDSTSAMSEAILEFMRGFAGFTDIETKRIVLFNRNREKFVPMLRFAQERYKKDLADRMEKAKKVQSKYEWTLPLSRVYKAETHHTEEAPSHALQLFYELNNASNPEKKFRQFLNNHNESILWWYKNGEGGKENYSVVYTGADGQPANFYVDFIIMLRNGRICLFDTKSANGGIGDSKEKHNALIKYIDHLNEENGTNHIGGIIVEEGGQWLYSPMSISNAGEHGGWNVFNPDMLNN